MTNQQATSVTHANEQPAVNHSCKNSQNIQDNRRTTLNSPNLFYLVSSLTAMLNAGAQHAQPGLKKKKKKVGIYARNV